MKIGFRKILLVFVILHFNSKAFAQIENKRDSQFFNFIYNFQFSEADSLLSTIDSTERSSHYNFLKSHYMRWYYLPIHQKREDILSRYNHYLESTDDESHSSDYTSVNSALLKAEFNYNQGNYYKGFQNGAIVYDVVKDNLESKPERIEMQFLAALYHYYYQYYKSENPVFGTMMWFFKEGDKYTGLKWLEEVAEDSSVLSTEALVYLAHIYLRLENKPNRALAFATQLTKRHPDNLKFYELIIECSLANNVETKNLAERIESLKGSSKIYFQKYGECYGAITNMEDGKQNLDEKILVLEEALNFIQKNGGGNHLSSLLYFQLYELTENKEYLKEKIKLEPYKNVLTGYPIEYSN